MMNEVKLWAFLEKWTKPEYAKDNYDSIISQWKRELDEIFK